MNRLKVASYAALWLLASVVNLVFVSRWLAERSLAQIDRTLGSGTAQVDARSQLLAAEAAQLADAVARAPAVVQALADDEEGAASAAARVAGEIARRVAGEAARPLLVTTSGSAGRTVQVDGAAVELDPQAEAVLWGAAGDGVRREGYVLAGATIYYAVAVPAGRGAGIAVGVPVTPAVLTALRSASGCDITLLVDGQPARTTLAPPEAAAIAAAARAATPGRPVGAGRLGAQPASGPLPMRTVSPLFMEAPAARLSTVGLKALPRAAFAVSVGTAALLGPVVSYQWLVLLATAALVLVGAVLAWLVTDEQPTVPRDLLAAADRIARGDLAARAPAMAGSLGTIAAALNSAAAAAQGPAPAPAAAPPPAPVPDELPSREPVAAAVPAPPGHAPAAPRDVDSTTQLLGDAEPLPVPAEPRPETPPLAEPAAPEAMAAEPAQLGVGATPGSEAAGVTMALVLPGRAASEPAPVPGEGRALAAAPEVGAVHATEAPIQHAEAAPLHHAVAPATEPPPTRLPEHAAGATVAEPRAAEAAEATAGEGQADHAEAQPAPEQAGRAEAAEDPDEEHWRAVYRDFLDVRERCGEAREAVPYGRFRQKLQANRDQLVVRHGCRTVRFQAYAKDGRAALRATPVR